MTDTTGGQGGWYTGPFDGVLRRRISFHADSRGLFGELWRSSWMTDLPANSGSLIDSGAPFAIAQANISRSDTGVLRGLHAHQRQADLWVVNEGNPFIALVDLRQAIAGDGRISVASIDASPGDALFLPAGVAHGFYARDPLTLIYFVTNEYDGTDEHGFLWSDPDAAIAWPDASPTVSPRDASAQSLADLLVRLRDQPGPSESR